MLRALGKNAEATRELERAAKLLPKEPQVHLQLAKAYEATDNWIAAVAELQKLLELVPQEPEYSYQLGKAWSKLSGWSYQQITRLNPASARLQRALGQEYAIQGKNDGSGCLLSEPALSDPHLPETHLARAVILFELRKLDEASARIDLERKLVPESKAAAEVRAKIDAAKHLIPIGHYRTGRGCVEKTRIPEHRAGSTILVDRLACSNSLLHQDQERPSEPPCRDLSDCNYNPSHQHELAAALKEHNLQLAEKILVEESEHDPKSLRSAKLLVMAGGIFFLDGKYLNSAICWKRAEAIAPLDDRSRFTLAMAYVRLSRRDLGSN